MTQKEIQDVLHRWLKSKEIAWEKPHPLHKDDREHRTPYWKTPPDHLAAALSYFLADLGLVKR